MAYKVNTHRISKPRSGMALGGIGAGSFELRHDGCTANWNICNNRPLGLGPHFTFLSHSMFFFIAKWWYPGEEPRMKLFQIEESHSVAGLERHEIQYIFPWLTGVDRIRYEARFPFVEMELSADDMPFDVRVVAWSSFIPRDVKNSSLPGAIFDVEIRNKGKRPVEVVLSANLRNPAGYDAPEATHTAEFVRGEQFSGFTMSCAGIDPARSSSGSISLLANDPAARCLLGWAHPHHYHERFLFEEDFPEENIIAGCNKPDPETGIPRKYSPYCWSSVGLRRRLPGVGKGAGKPWCSSFALAWHFPNNYAADVTSELDAEGAREAADRIEGNFYANHFADSAEVARYLMENREELEVRSRAFLDAFYNSSAPEYALDQINSNLNTFFTSTWLTKDGNFGVIEGLSPTRSFAGLSTVDVAMFGSVMYAALFPELAKQVHRSYASFQKPDGTVAHSISYNFAEINEKEANGHRLDLPAQFAFMSLREFFWSGDRAYLEEMYEPSRRAIEYVLANRDKNGDGLPDMEGIMCSYDNFPMFGVASFVAGQFLLAVKALSAAAEILGKADDAARYTALFEKGAAIFEDVLWNGKYYRLCAGDGGEHGPDEGCLTDQLIAEWGARTIGLAPLFNSSRVRKALKSILKMNYRPWQGVRNCQWPGDKFAHAIPPEIWVDQANTCWTGVELEFAALLVYEGLVEEGLQVVKTLDERYRLNGMYWDHQEFGGHYFRPMSAWSLVNAFAGLSLRDDLVAFAPALEGPKVRVFFATPNGHGHFERRAKGEGETLRLCLADGTLPVRELRLRCSSPWRRVEVIAGPEQAFFVVMENRDAVFRSDEICNLVSLELRCR